MILITTDDSKLGLEIALDSEGIDELMSYLHEIKKTKDHIHLTAGNELSEAANSRNLIRHVKLGFDPKAK